MSSFDAMKVILWCREAQLHRVRQLLRDERERQKLTPNGWREVVALLVINEQIRKYELEAFRARSDSAGKSAEQNSSAESFTGISSLDHIDRSLFREVIEQIWKMLDQEKQNVREEDNVSSKPNESRPAHE
jgi:hypothetical protein